MAFEIRLTVAEEGQRIILALRNAPRWMPRVADAISLRVVRRIERLAKKYAPVRTGAGRRGIGVLEVEDGHAIVMPLHMLVMEEGRLAGSAMPPIAPIERWARRVIGVRGLGFVIARSIAEKGIKPRRFLWRARVIATKRERGKVLAYGRRVLREELRKEAGSG